MSTTKRYSPEVKERATRMVFEHQQDYESQWAAISSIAEKVGCTPESLRAWVRQAETDKGKRPGPTSEEKERIKQLQKETRELKRANEILRLASAFFAPATYYEEKARHRDLTRLPQRQQRDLRLKEKILRIWKENVEVYGMRKVWRQLEREGTSVARCTIARLMRDLGLEGVVRGKTCFTTRPIDALPKPPDLVDRNFAAGRPNQLWVADFTFVATWTGFVYVAFVVDVFSRKIVGWRASASMKTDLGSGRLGAGPLREGRQGRARAPQRPRLAIPVHPVH